MRRPIAFTILFLLGTGGLVLYSFAAPRAPLAPAVEVAEGTEPVKSKPEEKGAPSTPAPATETAPPKAEAVSAELTIGSKAPLLDVSSWLPNAKGDLPPVTEFEPGKVYVVEFWATWCGPCIATIPHVAKLQEEFADRGVQVLSISSEPLATVNTFLDRPLGLTDPSTYRDLTSGYRIGSDPDESTARDYMLASGHNGIPISYVVGKDGHIEWIGPPRMLDEPLKEIVSDKWDRATFAVEYKEQRVVQEAFDLAAEQGQLDEALVILRRAQKESTSQRTRELAQTYVEIVELGKIEQLAVTSRGPLPPELEQYFADKPAEQASVFSQIILTHAEQGRAFSPAVMEFAVKLAERVAKESPQPEHFAYHAILQVYTDKLDEAIETQKRAVEAAKDDATRAKMQSLLDMLTKLKQQRALPELKGAPPAPDPVDAPPSANP